MRPDLGRLTRRVMGIAVAFILAVPIVLVILPDADAVPEFRSAAVVLEREAGPPIPSEAGPFRDLREDLDVVSLGDPSPHVVVPTRMERRSRRVTVSGLPVRQPGATGPARG